MSSGGFPLFRRTASLTSRLLSSSLSTPSGEYDDDGSFELRGDDFLLKMQTDAVKAVQQGFERRKLLLVEMNLLPWTEELA